jgi:hypothetical protein
MKGLVVNTKVMLLLCCFVVDAFLVKAEVFHVTEHFKKRSWTLEIEPGGTVGHLKKEVIRRFPGELKPEEFFLRCKNFATGSEEIVYDHEILSTLFASELWVVFTVKVAPIGLCLPDDIEDFSGEAPSRWFFEALIGHKAFIAQRLARARKEGLGSEVEILDGASADVAERVERATAAMAGCASSAAAARLAE